MKLFFLFFIQFSSIFAFSQSTFGIHVGGNFSSITNVRNEYNTKFSPHNFIGITYSDSINKSFIFSSDFTFTKKGYFVQFSKRLCLPKGYFNFKVKYADIGITLQYLPFKNIKNIQFYFLSGMSFNTYLGTDLEIIDITRFFDTRGHEYYPFETPKMFDFTLISGFGVKEKIDKKTYYQIETRFEHGLIGDNYNIRNPKHISFQVRVGLARVI
jgi:hypothetical protein